MRGDGIVHAKIYIVLRNDNLNCWLYFTTSIFDTKTVLKRFLCYILFYFLAINKHSGKFWSLFCTPLTIQYMHVSGWLLFKLICYIKIRIYALVLNMFNIKVPINISYNLWQILYPVVIMLRRPYHRRQKSLTITIIIFLGSQMTKQNLSIFMCEYDSTVIEGVKFIIIYAQS